MTSPTPSRVPLRTAEDDPQVAEVFARVSAAVGAVPNLYRALAHAPSILEGWIDYAWKLRGDAESDRGLRELAILRLAQLTGSEYVWRSHFKAARSGGIAEEKLHGLAEWAQSGLFTPAEAAVLQLTDELTVQATASDEAWDSMRSLFDDREAVELVLTVAWYSCVARVNAGLAVPLDDAHARVPPLPRTSDADGTAITHG